MAGRGRPAGSGNGTVSERTKPREVFSTKLEKTEKVVDFQGKFVQMSLANFQELVSQFIDAARQRGIKVVRGTINGYK